MGLPIGVAAGGDVADDPSWLRGLLEIGGGALFAFDASWRCVQLNENGARLLGRSAAELQGAGIWDLLPGARGGPIHTELERSRRSGTSVLFEAPGKGGRWFEVRALPRGDRLYVSVHDVSARRHQRETLVANEARLRSLVEATSQIIWRMSAEGRLSDESGSWAAFTGRSREELRGGGWLELIHPDDRDRVRAQHFDLVEHPRFLETTYRLRRHDGIYRLFSVRVAPVRDEDGRVQEFIGACVDIEKQHRAELERLELMRAFEHKREQLAAIIEALPVGVVLAEAPTGRVLQTNQAYEELHAGMPDSATGGSAGKNPIGHALRDGVRVDDVEERRLLPDGGERWLRTSALPLRDAAGAVVAALATTVDITSHKEAEAALRESEQRLRACMDALPTHVWSAAPDGRIDHFNPTWSQYTGMPMERTPGWDWAEFLHPEDREACAASWRQAVASGTPVEFEARIRGADGGYRWFLARALPVRDGQGRVERWFGANTDISERKQIEEFQHQLIGVVGHDLRSPLAAMLATVGTLLRRTPEDDALHRPLERLRKTAERMRRITRDLLDYTHARVGDGLPLTTCRTEVGELCRHAAGEARLLAPDRSISCAGPEPVEVCWDPGRIEQALSNLLANAIKYGSGDIDLRWSADPRQVRIEVENEGRPIPPELVSQLFRPFRQGARQEAPVTQSLGLGLFIVQEIARAHGGRASIEPLDRGNLVRLVLPSQVGDQRLRSASSSSARW